MGCIKEFSIHLVQCEAWWRSIGIHNLWKTIKQRVIHFGYPTMHLVSYISESIWRMGFSDNFTTNISDRLHIGNGKEAYQSTNKVDYIQQMRKHNDQCTGLDYMEETPLYLALQSLYNIDSATVSNLHSAADKGRNTRRTHLFRLQHCMEEPLFHPVWQLVYHLREIHVRGVFQKYQINLTQRCISRFQNSQHWLAIQGTN